MSTVVYLFLPEAHVKSPCKSGWPQPFLLYIFGQKLFKYLIVKRRKCSNWFTGQSYSKVKLLSPSEFHANSAEFSANDLVQILLPPVGFITSWGIWRMHLQSICGQNFSQPHLFSCCKLFILLINCSNSLTPGNWNWAPFITRMLHRPTAHKVEWFCMYLIYFPVLQLRQTGRDMKLFKWHLFVCSCYFVLLLNTTVSCFLFSQIHGKYLFFSCLTCMRWETFRLLVGFKSSP